MAAFDLSLGVIVFFAVLSLVASIVNGGLGYGYSSISTPLAILVFANRVLNPAYVLLEAVLNTFMLAVSGKKNIAATYRRTLPVILALVPGVIIGSLILNAVAPLWIRFAVYFVILPLILLQAAGFRKPLKGEAKAGVPLGLGIGLLYSITTISGPPIALFWNNQGLKQKEFKAAVAQIRIAESYMTSVVYFMLGLFTVQSLTLFSVISPPVLIGIPIGMFIVSRVAVETFRRVCMSFDAGIVGYGLSATLPILFGVSPIVGDVLFVAVLAIDVGLLYRYLKERPKAIAAEAGPLEARQGLSNGAGHVSRSGELSETVRIELNKEAMMLVPWSITKGVGPLAALAELNVDSQNVMVVGDGENDISILRVGGVKVALENAVPALKSEASYVTAEENGKGVSEAIAKFLGPLA